MTKINVQVAASTIRAFIVAGTELATGTAIAIFARNAKTGHALATVRRAVAGHTNPRIPRRKTGNYAIGPRTVLPLVAPKVAVWVTGSFGRHLPRTIIDTTSRHPGGAGSSAHST